MLHHGSVGLIQTNQCNSLFTFSFFPWRNCFYHLHFFLSFFFFFFFIIFVYFFKFPWNCLQQNINQSEIGIGDKKLLVELYHLMSWIKLYFVWKLHGYFISVAKRHGNVSNDSMYGGVVVKWVKCGVLLVGWIQKI